MLSSFKNIKQLDSSWGKELSLLFKLKLSLTVLMSSLFAYAIVAGAAFDCTTFGLLMLGGAGITFSANAFNELLEKEYDALMVRTSNRPLVKGSMTPSMVILLAGLMALFGTCMLSCISPTVGFLGLISLVLYAFIYTPLKRYTPISVYVGAIPGALPVAIGAMAADASMMEMMLLFGIQFFWQLPHFWAIAWVGNDDYMRAGFRLLPNRANKLDASVGYTSMVHTLFILPLLFIGYAFSLLGLGTCLILTVLTIWYAQKGLQLALDKNTATARKMMFASFIYLPLIFTFLLLDVWI